jgi:hypothetical protein
VGQDTDGQHYTLGANGWIPASYTVTEFLKLYKYFVIGCFFSWQHIPLPVDDKLSGVEIRTKKNFYLSKSILYFIFFYVHLAPMGSIFFKPV